MRNKLILLSIATLAFFGCKKDDNDPPADNTSKTTFITQQSWKFNNAGLDPDKDGNINTDISGFVDNCLKDNVVSFSANGSGSMDEALNKCNSALQTTPFTWAFANNETNINISGDVIAGKGGQYKIVALNATQFSLSKDTVYLGVSTTVVVNLKH